MAKTKDIFLNIAANPDLTLEDLVSVGLTSENTVLLDRAQYASNERVQDMFRDSEGNFDERKFNTFYDLAEQSYNIIAQDEANISLLDVTAYDADNIFVDPSKRKRVDKPYAVKLPNPDRLNVGITRIGKIGPRTLSQDEIAQTQEVLLNPVAVQQGAKPIYGKSPNDSWFEDFWDTKVMAAWDEDGTHIDPVTGKEVQHKAGDLKLNENGTYYYESLDGRSVYGKRILNKFNTLTTDGSALNKYDFFDSDDIKQKSIGGSIAKNLALVGSMFIPYVGWGVAAASVAHQSAGLFATLGKMLAGSDNETLNAVEGWVKSVDRRTLKTEYAQQNTWCWENFIDLIGDTTAQLREQRAIFKFVPGIIKGDFKALSDKAMKEYGEKLVKESMENVTSKSFNDIARIAYKQDPLNQKQKANLLLGETKGVFSAKAEKVVRDYVQSYYKLGEPIAKAYMTAITVQDTFGEAIEAGATDGEATLLTLGYAAAEAALLSTDLGKWIMPELRTDKLRNEMIAKKLLELPTETREMSRQLTRLSGKSKKAWAKRLFNVGKDIATAEYSMMPKTIGTILAQGLGEGIEEVSEEALADFSKSCFNLVQKLQGDDVHMNAWNHNWNWQEAANRYGMSFAGGIMGGGINAAASDYKANREILQMNSQQAMQQLVYMARNNELEDFWKTVNKTTLASKELSTQLNEDGTGYKPGTKEDNQDLAAKKALRKQIDLINSILNAENAKLDDDGLLSALIKADPALKDMDPVKEYRMRALSNSATAGRFLNEWNTITSDIIKNHMDQHNIKNKYADKSSDKYSEEDERDLKNLQKKLKELQKRKDEMLEGGRTREFVRDALFEMSHGVNESFNTHITEAVYAEYKTGKKYKDLSEAEKADLHTQYETFKGSTEYAEKIHELADIYETMAITASNGIQSSADFYEQLRKDGYKNIQDLHATVKQRLNVLKRAAFDPNEGIASVQEILSDRYKDDLTLFNDSEKLVQDIKNRHAQAKLDKEDIIKGRTEDQLTDQEKYDIALIDSTVEYETKLDIFESVFDKFNSACDEFVKVGFIHPEVKHALTQMGETLKNYTIWEKDNEEERDLYHETRAPFAERYEALEAKLNEVKSLSNTPIVENLRTFASSTVTDQSILDLIDYLHSEEIKNQDDIKALNLDSITIQHFKDAKDLLKMYRSAIVGARYDNLDLDNIIGFNTTLNEISGKEESLKLAEIDAQTSDLILEDINKLLSRINYMEQVHKLNTGDKYAVQDKTALNKQFIMFNKIKSLVSILEQDEEWNKGTSFEELQKALRESKTLSENSGFGKSFKDRNFSLSLDQKKTLEKESIILQKRLYQFFAENIDLSDDIKKEESVNKLAKLLTYDNFKGLIRKNDDYLNQYSEDIDDSAFIWWLCASAALDADQFYNNYRHILGTEKEGEKPIAPIPTQELGVFALTAAITNGDMFSVFGKAIRKSLGDFWDNASIEKRQQVIDESELYCMKTDDLKPYFKNNDFLPNFDNILFVEGIAGSGKTVGVLSTLSKLLAKTNPEFVNQKVIFAHTNQNKANKLGKSAAFTNYEAHDHDSLLKFMSADYSPIPMNSEGVYQYQLNKDVFLSDGIFRANWKVRKYQDSEVPKLIIIDEWSHYNQVEQDLIQRFASEYGITVLAMGDYDQLTPESEIFGVPGPAKGKLGISPNRNATPRIAKLGVSMRTDNTVKNENIYRMLAWVKSPSQGSIDLHYFEDETGIYGDKLYKVDTVYGNTLQSIQNDIKKMVSTLKVDEEGNQEKIGYVYSDTKSELYQWLTTTDGIKEHILPLLEKDAHGEEAQYYIVENNRKANQDALSYFRSVYTGITRSGQGSILISSNNKVQHTLDEKTNQPLQLYDKYNKAGVSFSSTQDQEMLPNTYSEAGTKDFTKKRKNTLDSIYGSQDAVAFDIKTRTKQVVPLNIQTGNKPGNPNTGTTTPSSNQTTQAPQASNTQQPAPNNAPTTPTTPTQTTQPQSTTQPTQQTTTQSQSNTPPAATQQNPDDELPPIPEDTPQELFDQMDLTERKPSINEVPPARTDEEIKEEKSNNSAWQGPFPLHQTLYAFNSDSRTHEITGEKGSDYILKNLETGVEFNMPKQLVHSSMFTSLPKEPKLLNVGDSITHTNGNIYTLKQVLLDGDSENPHWRYVFGNLDIDHSSLKQRFENGTITHYKESETAPLEAKPNEHEIGSQQDYEQSINEVVCEPLPQAVTQSPDSADIDFNLLGFTFNTRYYADEFDKNGDIVDSGDARIDCGYGLSKMNRNFKNKKDIKPVIDSIRSYLEFKSNSEILSYITSQTGVHSLGIRWGFVSKTPNNGTGKYSRYNAPKAIIEGIPQEGIQVHEKSLSAIIFNGQTGQAVLEIPMIMLQSPHSIFHQMKEAGIGQDILQIWGKKAPKETPMPYLQEIISYIENNKQGLPGYQNLASVLKLWLFTNNGIKFLPKGWNLHDEVTNLGNLFIVHKEADDVEELNYDGSWQDLPKLEQGNRYISDIYMSNSDYYEPVPGQVFPAVSAYTPYVLISDSPDITNDAQAVNRYLYQITHPNSEQIVTLVPISGPEVSVSEYITEMNNLIKRDPSDKTPIPFGNPYTSYRIWDVILNAPDSVQNFIMDKLSEEQKQEVRNMVSKLNQIASEVDSKAYSRTIEYKKAVAKKQNKYNAESQCFPKLRKLLVKTCFYDAFNADNYRNENILNAIQQLCDQPNSGITGVPCKAQFASTSDKGIAKFAYKVKVDPNDRFKFPGYGYFRSYGKVDTPTYNLSSIQNSINNWAQDAKLRLTVINPETGEERTYDNIWHFQNKGAEHFYLPGKQSTSINPTNLLNFCEDLIGKLGLSNYNIDASIFEGYTSEPAAKDKALQLIHEEFKKIPGAFIIRVNGEYKYGNIDKDQTSEWAGFMFSKVISNQGNYTLEFYNNNETKQIEIELDKASNSFIIPTLPKPSQSLQEQVKRVHSDIVESKKSEIFKHDLKLQQLFTDILRYIDPEKGILNSEAIQNLLEQSGLDDLTKGLVEATLTLDDQNDEQNLDCVIPTKIGFIL